MQTSALFTFTSSSYSRQYPAFPLSFLSIPLPPPSPSSRSPGRYLFGLVVTPLPFAEVEKLVFVAELAQPLPPAPILQVSCWSSVIAPIFTSAETEHCVFGEHSQLASLYLLAIESVSSQLLYFFRSATSS
jgi:hypothetical protein